MKVFIVGLGRTETGAPGKSCLHLLNRAVEQVKAGREDGILNQVMVVYAETCEEGKLVHLPFVLKEGTSDAHLLIEFAVVTQHLVVQGVLLILNPSGECGRGKEELAQATGVHPSHYPCEVVGFSVSVFRLLCAVIGIAVDVLRRGER